jgi:hypothetical protein
LICFFVIVVSTVVAQTADQTFLAAASERAGVSLAKFSTAVCDHQGDPISSRIIRDYGALFVASENVTVPNRCVFPDGDSVATLQARAKLATAKIGNVEITLQEDAMRALLDAIEEAKGQRLKITPLDGKIAGTRNYEDTVRLWNSRFYRALDHWQRRGRITRSDADAARALSPFQQVPVVLKWEEQGIWFSTGFNRSILTSVAAPGTSQHLSGLAFDIVEYRSSRVRSILNERGWFQTVISDEPHFTYLGRLESDLPKFGLISKHKNGYKFWVPEIQ